VRMCSKAIHLRIRLPHTTVYDFEFDGVLSLSSLLSSALFVLVTVYFLSLLKKVCVMCVCSLLCFLEKLLHCI
jgi:hypothetical protein